MNIDITTDDGTKILETTQSLQELIMTLSKNQLTFTTSFSMTLGTSITSGASTTPDTSTTPDAGAILTITAANEEFQQLLKSITAFIENSE
jgi:hypothetical protein